MFSCDGFAMHGNASEEFETYFGPKDPPLGLWAFLVDLGRILYRAAGKVLLIPVMCIGATTLVILLAVQPIAGLLFRWRMQRAGRTIPLREVRRICRESGGTLILEHGFDILPTTRLWWTADDVHSGYPEARLLEDLVVLGLTELQPNLSWFSDYIGWLRDRYLDPRDGKALLVYTFQSASRWESLSREFQGVHTVVHFEIA